MGVLGLLSSPGGLLPLGVLLLVAAGAWRWVERRNAAARTPVHTIRLTGQHALHVVQLQGRCLVIGTGPGAAPTLVDASSAPSTSPREDRWTPS